MMYRTKKTGRRYSLAILLCALQLMTAAALHAAASDISVEIVLERQEAAIGEPLAMQIRVNGANKAEMPDLSRLDAFTVQERGGQSTSSTSVSNVNGSWERITHLGYIFNYTIIPQRAGSLTVPALALTVEGRTYRTEPVTVTVKEPRETDDMKLRIFLSAESCYVGEPVTMVVTWFVGRDVNGFEFQLPVLADPRFELIPLTPQSGGPGQQEIKIPMGNDTVTAVKSKGDLDGREFLTVTFQYLLVPKEAGRFTLPGATVACRTVSDLRRVPGRSPFNGFGNLDDFFGNGAQPAYRTQAIPSNKPVLNVEALPDKDKPADFSGLVGEYAISAEASPRAMNIGDPVTLTVTISGPSARQAKLPDLERFLPPAAFKIPEEIAAGDMAENKKIFTQTIRVKDPAVTSIPPIELTYFDPAAKSYRTARTAPIPITARATRVVTSSDAEGRTAGSVPKEPLAAKNGLAGNYRGEDALIDQQARISFLDSWLPLVIAAPPLLFCLAFFVSFMKKRRAREAERRKTRLALRRLERQLGTGTGLSPENISAALNEYLGVKLDKNAASLTFHDVEPALRVRCVSEEAVAELRELLAQYEKWRYAGRRDTCADIGQLIDQTLAVARRLDPYLP